MFNRKIEFLAGLFVISGFLALAGLALKVSGIFFAGRENYYTLIAEFDNIGSLKEGAPVVISGVNVGRVLKIALDPSSFRAEVVLQINKKVDKLPKDTSASVLTEGILGSNYIGLSPGFDTMSLGEGDRIESTNSALVLENLIGQIFLDSKNQQSSITGKAK